MVTLYKVCLFPQQLIEYGTALTTMPDNGLSTAA